MKLLGDFCKLIENKENNFTVIFNAAHFIYQAHFPNNPITPGVCIIQIVKELLENRFAETLVLHKINNLKFLAPINPQKAENVNFTFQKIEKTENGYKFSVLVQNDTTQFAKMSGEVEKI
jgi:3-hydroxyacyl-[acyl-carrier-protein] dehydratase